MSDGTITQREMRRLAEAEDLDGRTVADLDELIRRFPHGDAIRTKAAAASEARADAQGKLKALREQIERTGDVRL